MHYLVGQNEFYFLFNKYNKVIYFAFFGCWLLHEKLGDSLKNALPDSGAAAPKLCGL